MLVFQLFVHLENLCEFQIWTLGILQKEKKTKEKRETKKKLTFPGPRPLSSTPAHSLFLSRMGRFTPTQLILSH